MNNTGTNAKWLVPTFLTKYFASTNKKHLILTGDRGCGKSTCLSSCVQPEYGFYTKAIPKERVVYTDIQSGEQFTIGRYDENLGKMVADDKAFKQACNSLERAIVRGQCLYFDEIGYIEREQKQFLSLIDRALNTRQVFAVVRKADEEHINAIKSRSDVCVVDLTAQKVKLGCIVMASGLSKRFGANKLIQPLSHKLVAEYAVDNALCCQFDKRLLLTRTSEVKSFFDEKINCILHDKPTRNEAISLGVDYMSDMDGIMFMQADQPLVSQDSINNLIFAFRQNPNNSYRLAYANSQASPAIFPKRLFGELTSLPPHKGGNYIFANGERAQSIFANNEYELLDIDTREDLENLKKHL